MDTKNQPSQRVASESREDLLRKDKLRVQEDLENLNEILPLTKEQLDFFWDDLYSKYFQKFEWKTGYFEVDGNEIQFVDRSLGKIPIMAGFSAKVMPTSRMDVRNESVKISAQDISRGGAVHLPLSKIVQYLNFYLRQFPSDPATLKNDFWEKREQQQHSLEKTHRLAFERYGMVFDFSQPEGRRLGKLLLQEHPKLLLDHIESVVNAKLFPEKYLIQLVRRAGKVSPNGILKNRETVASLNLLSEKDLSDFCDAAEKKQEDAVLTVISENHYRNPGRFLKDPALKIWMDVLVYAEKSLDKNDIVKGISVEEKSLLIARYLYMKGIRVMTPENVKQAVSQIEKRKRELKKVPLFQGREVVFAANNETMKKYGEERFGPQVTRDAISNQSKKFHFFRPEKGKATEMPKRILDKIKSIKEPFTFVFDGHGTSNDRLSLEEKWDWFSQLHVDDFVRVLEERNDPADLPLEKRPVFVFLSCYGHNFIRELYSRLREKNICLPICISASEYGQLATGRPDYTYHNSTLTNVFNLGEKDPVTFERLFSRQLLSTTNFTIWGVDEKNIPIQLVEQEVSHNEGENTA